MQVDGWVDLTVVNKPLCLSNVDSVSSHCQASCRWTNLFGNWSHPHIHTTFLPQLELQVDRQCWQHYSKMKISGKRFDGNHGILIIWCSRVRTRISAVGVSFEMDFRWLVETSGGGFEGFFLSLHPVHPSFYWIVGRRRKEKHGNLVLLLDQSPSWMILWLHDSTTLYAMRLVMQRKWTLLYCNAGKHTFYSNTKPIIIIVSYSSPRYIRFLAFRFIPSDASPLMYRIRYRTVSTFQYPLPSFWIPSSKLTHSYKMNIVIEPNNFCGDKKGYIGKWALSLLLGRN